MMFFLPFGHYFYSDTITMKKAGWWLHVTVKIKHFNILNLAYREKY